MVIEILKKVPKTREWAERLRWEFWALGAICIFIATFQAWHEEHDKVLARSTYMEVSTQSGPPSPTPIFREGQKPLLNFGLQNGPFFLAEDCFAFFGLVVKNLDYRWDPQAGEKPPTSPEIESAVFEQLKRDNANKLAEPRTRLTVDPGGWSWQSARTAQAITQEQAIGLRYGDKMMYFVGFIEWHDGSGTHEKRYCRIVQPPGDTSPFVLESCVSHNDFLPIAKD